MRTNIVIDDEVIADAMHRARIKTRREMVGRRREQHAENDVCVEQDVDRYLCSRCRR